jgi:hypothetical protein
MFQQKLQALIILEGVRSAALKDQAIYLDSKYASNVRSVEDSCIKIRDWITNEKPPGNPAYNAFSPAVSKLLILAATRPDTYSTLIAPLDYDGNVASLYGLFSLYCLLSGVSDDHDFHLDAEGSEVTIRYTESYEGRQLKYITPERLLECLEQWIPTPT